METPPWKTPKGREAFPLLSVEVAETKFEQLPLGTRPCSAGTIVIFCSSLVLVTRLHDDELDES